MYARDTSRKIRSALMIKMKEGSYIGRYAPYGYQKSEKNKNKFVIDKDASSIVKKIFDMASHGAKPSEIARYLNGADVPTPSAYRCSKNPDLDLRNFTELNRWTSSKKTS
ncbi:MAG: recombinase family protein [Oscillospiraceae bacterium]|nr:recombinase family protein [Oscillospiraceae bacterium]